MMGLYPERAWDNASAYPHKKRQYSAKRLKLLPLGRKVHYQSEMYRKSMTSHPFVVHFKDHPSRCMWGWYQRFYVIAVANRYPSLETCRCKTAHMMRAAASAIQGGVGTTSALNASKRVIG